MFTLHSKTHILCFTSITWWLPKPGFVPVGESIHFYEGPRSQGITLCWQVDGAVASGKVAMENCGDLMVKFGSLVHKISLNQIGKTTIDYMYVYIFKRWVITGAISMHIVGHLSKQQLSEFCLSTTSIG